MAINAGSLLSTLITPILRSRPGADAVISSPQSAAGELSSPQHGVIALKPLLLFQVTCSVSAATATLWLLAFRRL